MEESATSEKLHVHVHVHDMCTKRRLISVCASAQSDQSLRCPHKETLKLYLS